MDKNAIKKYAVWARTELIARVRQRAEKYEISADADPNADSVSGRVLSAKEETQRQAAIVQMRQKGYENVIEEVAYIWFNRFAALRYMEVNNYLPSRVRVFTDENGDFKPQILTEAIHLSLDGLDMDKVYEYKEKNANDELYKYLLITQCNALSVLLPTMFQHTSNYTELLFPDNVLREGSVLEQMVTLIPEDNWKDAVQIIGWLYQYYNTEPKDKVFADLKKNIKITKENIPAATQLFTPDWIVRYMVENSLGRLWLERHPNDALKAQWKYYVEEAEQESAVAEQLKKMRSESPINSPEDITFIDPCMGSGHILVYAFDVLMQIYESVGYNQRDAAMLIIRKNLFGLDIDKRAYQLAHFSVVMKARQYNRSLFTDGGGRGIPIACFEDAVTIDAQLAAQWGNKEFDALLAEFEDVDEYGSLLKIKGNYDLDRIFEAIKSAPQNPQISMTEIPFAHILGVTNLAKVLTQKYDVVCTNPPYMGSSGMGGKLSEYTKKNYPDSKADLFAVFIEKCGEMLNANGYQAMITQHAWMFLSSYEKLRAKLMHRSIINMAHLGARAFEEIGGEVVQTTAFVLHQFCVEDYLATYARLVDYNSQQAKADAFLIGDNRHVAKQRSFEKIPGAPMAYWVIDIMMNLFDNPCVDDVGTTRHGMTTGNNDRFLRLWFEVSKPKIGFGLASTEEAAASGRKWFPYNKGGEYRKWYGNNTYIVDYENDGAEMKEFTSHLPQGTWVRVMSREYYFLTSLTWTKTSSTTFGVRFSKRGAIFDVAGSTLYPNGSYEYMLGLLNTNIAFYFLRMLNPTLSIQTGDIKNLPYIESQHHKSIIEENVNRCIEISNTDWDSFETSWDFQTHPLISGEKNIAAAFDKWQQDAETRFTTLKANEEELNRIFIDIYGLQDELTPEVEGKDVTVRSADLGRDIRSFISYAVGCMFGRYSLDIPGLAYAGGEWDASKYTTFAADADNILPICDDEYFDDDIAGLFVKFVATVYGENTLNENLKFIADALGGKGSPKDVIRDYFLSERGFYADHCKIYQKRPIYWLFDSGKKNGFKALVYMHRYQPDTIARMRTDYVHEQQSRYRTAIADLENRINGASTAERVRLNKQLIKLQDQSAEILGYEEKIHHLADQMIAIDLDDGVKHNYEIFKDVLAKIK